MSHTHFSLALRQSAVALALVAAGGSAQAALVEYVYEGNAFDDPAAQLQGYTRVRVAFTLDDSLVPRSGRFVMNGHPQLPGFPLVHFAFEDGVNSISDTLPAGESLNPVSIVFDTDASGAVSGEWRLEATKIFGVSGGPRPDLVAVTIISSSADSQDFTSQSSCCSGTFMFTSGQPGRWTLAPAPVPVPAAWLGALSACAVGLRFARRR